MARSTEELSDLLSRDRGWRIKEISSVMKLAGATGQGPVEREFYCRGGATLFYAHWEGFIKRAAQNYLTYVAFQRLSLDEMADFVMALYLRPKLSGSVSQVAMVELGHRLLRSPKFKPKLNVKLAIDTESNLSSTVLQKILSTIGLPSTNFEPKFNAIDATILSYRHPIAHGAKGDVDVARLVEIGSLVIELTALFKDEIENAAVLKSFSRSD